VFEGAGRVPFAVLLVTHKKARAAVAVAGIAFAVLFVFLELGFFGAVRETALGVARRIDADILLVSAQYLHLADSGTIPRGRLFEAVGVDGVQSASPIYLRYARWRDRKSGQRCSLLAIGFPLDEPPPLKLDGLADQAAALQQPQAVLVDRLTQDSCGEIHVGDEVEVREQSATVVGRYSLGIGFLGDGSLLMSDQTFSQLFDGHPLGQVFLGRVKLRPGADPKGVVEALRRALPRDTRVLTLAEVLDIQERHWVRDTAIGNIFALGAAVGFCVALMVLYQVLATDVRAQLPQYATLKAMGYESRRLYGYVLQQAWIFALVGYVPALLASLALYRVTRTATLLPIAMSTERALLVLGLSLLMCTGAGALTLGRLRRADPAELF
jgi:putative ABC transport system permease protein